jgi:hypothetical protein
MTTMTMNTNTTKPRDDAELLDAVACRAAAAIEAVSDASPATTQRLRAFSAAASARPAFDLYQHLRDARHECAARAPALARRLRRLGRLVERYAVEVRE